MTATLLTEYLVNEASSGQGPTQVLDTLGHLPLTISYNGAKPQYTSIPAGDGLSFDYSGSAKAQSASAAGTPLELAYATATIQTAVYVATLVWKNTYYYVANLVYNDAALANYGCGIYSTNSGSCSVVCETTSGGCEVLYAGPTDGTTVVVVVQVDTREAVAGDRVKCWYNNVLQTPTGGFGPAINSYLQSRTTDVVTVGLDEGAPAASSGLFYGAFLSGTLSSAEIASVTASLLANNDVSPFASAPADNATFFGMPF